jgi:hypothetical protein
MRKDRGLALLAAHCLSLDPETQTARQRLDASIGPELAEMLVLALSSDGAGAGRRRADALLVRPVFAA